MGPEIFFYASQSGAVPFLELKFELIRTQMALVHFSL
jgi:hypothetical protein